MGPGGMGGGRVGGERELLTPIDDDDESGLLFFLDK